MGVYLYNLSGIAHDRFQSVATECMHKGRCVWFAQVQRNSVAKSVAPSSSIVPAVTNFFHVAEKWEVYE